MKLLPAFLLFSIALALPYGAAAGDAAYTVRYEGGNLGLTHRKVTATVGNGGVMLANGRQRISVPATAITEIAYGNEVRRRFGAAVLGAVSFKRLGEAETHYVGVSWVDSSRNEGTSAKSEAIFRLTNSEYRDFLTALEHMTGKKAVDTNQVPTTVRYGL